MHRIQPPIGGLRKHDPQTLQPLKDIGGLGDQGIHQFRVVLKVSPSHHIEVVIVGRVLLELADSLNPPLSHHCIGIAMTELIRYNNLCSIFLGEEGGSRPCPPSSDYQHIRLRIHMREVNQIGIDPALRL